MAINEKVEFFHILFRSYKVAVYTYRMNFSKPFISGVGRLIFVQQFYRGVIDNGDKLIADVVVTSD
jgi:hypothetical protein